MTALRSTRTVWVRRLGVVGTALGMALVLTVGVVYVRSFGDAPQSPGHNAWLDQAHTALDEVSSDLATAQLLLQLIEHGRVLGHYEQVVALNSESAAGKVSDHLGAEQPGLADQATFSLVTGVLSDASDLLSTVRIAVVRRDSSQYPKLDRALTHMQGRISQAETRVPS
jgi:hypothetical protein